MDEPDSRKVHTQPIPRLGGVGIFLAFMFSVLVHTEITLEIRAILVGGLVIFTTGLLDDIRNLSARKKFLGQIAACTFTMVMGDLYIVNLGNLLGLGEIVLPFWVAAPFTVFALVGVINAINLIDGLDGLAGGVATIALSAFLLMGFSESNGLVVTLSAALIGAVLGFLKYNCYPARIFMGDAGSLTVGFFLGFFSVMLTQGKGAGEFSPVLPLIILGLPIADTIRVMARRAIRGASPFSPDQSHVHHQFLGLGFHHRFTVVIIYGISIFWAMFALSFYAVPDYFLFWTYLAVNSFSYFALKFIGNHKEQFSILRFDSAVSLRDTRPYRFLSAASTHGTIILAGLLCLYLWIILVRTGPPTEALRDVAMSVFVCGLILFLLTRDIRNHFFLIYLFAASLILFFHNQKWADSTLLGHYTQGQVSTIFFIIAAGIVFLKIIFRDDEEKVLGTPLDFLILAMSITLTVILPKSDVLQNFEMAVAQAVVFFLVMRFISSFGVWPTRVFFCTVQVGLAFILLKSFYGY